MLKNILVVFTKEYTNEAKEIYDFIDKNHEGINTYMITVNDIICPLKINDSFDTYILVGNDCPMHHFANKNVYKYNNIVVKNEEDQIVDIKENDCLGNCKIYRNKTDMKEFLSNLFVEDKNICNKLNSCCIENKKKKTCEEKEDKERENSCSGNVCTQKTEICEVNAYKNKDAAENNLVLEENLKIYEDYFKKVQNECESSFFMKENIKGKHFADKTVFAIIFTSIYYEKYANEAYNLLKKYKSNVFKLFLKDVNYERLISVDSVDCIILIDCPMFECNINIHIPIINVFNLCRGIDQQWVGDNFIQNKVKLYKTDKIENNSERSILIRDGDLAQILVKREFQGVEYKTSQEDMEIHKGRRGIANAYESEGKK